MLAGAHRWPWCPGKGGKGGASAGGSEAARAVHEGAGDGLDVFRLDRGAGVHLRSRGGRAVYGRERRQHSAGQGSVIR